MSPFESAVPLLSGAPNFRDLGGHLSGDGRQLRRGRVYRSQVLADIDERDLAVLASLGIGAVCDLRGRREAGHRPNRWPAGRDPLLLIPQRPSQGGRKANPSEWVQAIAHPDFDPAQARGWMLELYRRMPEDFSAHLGLVLNHLVQDGAAPMLIHCEAGKDRTGFVCALLLLALGVDESKVYEDYLLSARHYRFESLQRRAEIARGEPLPPHALQSLQALATVHAEYLQAALDALREQHGDTERYLREAVGFDAAALARLRAQLLE